MREIKFRAWNKTTKTMHEVDYINFVNKTISVLTFDIWEFAFEDMDLMQYIGLKDKNGVEIYENYIVTFNNDGETIEAIVEFRLGKYTARDIRYSESDFDEYYDIYDLHEIYHTIGSELEVIGNIYENAELLK